MVIKRPKNEVNVSLFEFKPEPLCFNQGIFLMAYIKEKKCRQMLKSKKRQ